MVFIKIPVFRLSPVLALVLSALLLAEALGAPGASPRLMVVIEEKLLEVPASQTAESAMIRELLLAGYDMVDSAQAQKLREQVKAEVLSVTQIEKEALQKIGEDLDCDILIVGKAVADHFASSGVVKAYVADIEIRIVSTSTAQILATFSTKAKGRGYEPGPAIRAALEKAGIAATQEILSKNLLGIRPPTRLFVIGLSDGEVESLAGSLAQSLGVEKHVLYASHDLSEILLGPGEKVAPERVVELVKSSQAPPLELSQRAGYKIVARRKGEAGPRDSAMPRQSPAMQPENAKWEKEDRLVLGDLIVDPIHLQHIYPARLLNYSRLFAEATVKNQRTNGVLENVQIRLFLPEVMSLPCEKLIPSLGPGQVEKIRLPAIFDRDRLFSGTETRMTNAELEISYEGREPAQKHIQVQVCGRNAMNWKEAASILNFVTLTDPVVKNFTASALSRLDLSGVRPCMTNILRANALFTALSSLPLRYLPDPNSDFTDATLDYVQFPRETLDRKSGDCDDLSVLFASCLESVGIPVRFFVTRDHIFLEFATGMCSKSWADIYFSPQRFSLEDGSLWIPLEMTKFCPESPCFLKAWSEASERYGQLKGKGQMQAISSEQYMGSYPPFPLPESKQEPTTLPRDLNVRIAESTGVFYEQREVALKEEKDRLRKQISESQNTEEAMNSLGVLLCKSGEIQEAKKLFLSLLEKNQSHPKARNNLGNAYLLLNDPSSAVDEFRLIPEGEKDPEVLYNMAVAHFLKRDREKSVSCLRKASERLRLDSEERKLAWLLGVSDLRYLVGAFSEPWLEEFKSLIYEAVPGARKPSGSPSSGILPAVGAQEERDVSGILWWKL